MMGVLFKFYLVTMKNTRPKINSVVEQISVHIFRVTYVKIF